jgi:hypothetical protein
MPEANLPSGRIVDSTEINKEEARFSVTGLNTAGALAALEPARFRVVLISFLGGAVGLIAGCIAFLLYKLIGLFTNIAFYGGSAPRFRALLIIILAGGWFQFRSSVG